MYLLKNKTRYCFADAIICVFALLLALFIGFVDASTSKPVGSTQNFVSLIDIPAGLSIGIGVSSTYSGNITIKSPSGKTTNLNFNNLSGPYSSSIALNEIGVYEVTENYTIVIVAKPNLPIGDQTSTSTASNTWTFDNINIGNGKFKATSSVTGASATNIVGEISVSLSSNSLPLTATITTIGLIPQNSTISATVSGTWNVNSSIEPPPETGTIEVQTNHSSATFVISGPENYNGGGKSWTKANALIGEYTINYVEVQGYKTPTSEKKILAKNGKITFVGQYEPKVGTIEVSTNLDEANYSISGPEGSVYNGSGKTWSASNALIGKYIITFYNVSGYDTPYPSVQTLTEGGKITFSGLYNKLIPGTIEVHTNLEEATFLLVGPSAYNGSGMNWIQTNASLGMYTVNYWQVDGYETPPSEQKILTSGGIIIFNAEYKKIYPGTIEVFTNIDEANFSISGPSNYNGNGKAWSQSDVPIGSYTVTYANVDGYRTPLPETNILPSGGKIAFNAVYRQIIPNAIEVYTNLDEAIFEIKGTENYSGGGKEWIKSGVPTGDYTVIYGELSDYKTPSSETKRLGEGQAIIFNAEYFPKTGNIVVNTNLSSAKFNISGRANYSGEGSAWIKTNAPVGEYTIIYDDIPNYITPPPSLQKLNPNGTITFIGEYKKYDPGTIEVKSNINDASFTILGPINYEGKGAYWKNEEAPPGEYIIFYDDLPNYDKPQSEKKQLSSKEKITFAGNYIAHVGNLTVETNTDDAKFQVIGPNNVTYNGSGKSWTQNNVLVGDYTIAYENVLFYEKPVSEVKSLARDSAIKFTGEYKPVQPTIQKVTVIGSPATSKSTIRINVITDTKCDVTFSIENIKSGKLTELSVGSYSTSFTPPIGFDVVDVPVNIKVVNGINLEATDSNQKITIDTLAQINSVVLSNEMPYVGENVSITVLGDPKSNVSFAINSLTQGQMVENAPGVYSVTFLAFKATNGNVPVEIKLLDKAGNIATNSEKTIAVIEKLTGNIKIKTNGIDSTFTVTHLGTNKVKNGNGTDWEWLDAPIGDYNVKFNSVSGYITPSPQTQTLGIGETIVFNGNYVSVLGMIEVRTNLEDAKFGIKGTAEYNGSGQVWLQQNVQAGQWTITYQNVDGYETPLSETKTLVENGKIIFIGAYKPKYGIIEVITNLNEAKFKITGTAEFEGEGKSWTKQAPEGVYNITFFDVANYMTPMPSSETLTTGGSIIFYGNYEVDKGTIIVRTNLDLAEFKLIGPAVYEGNGKYWSVNDAPKGQYTIEYKGVLGYKTPLPETKALVGDSIAFIGGYEEEQPPASPNRVQFANKLMPNFPNPCNPGTWIPFSLSESGEVNIIIYDISGRVVRKLELGYKNPGIYATINKSAYWDGNNEYGEKVVSGVYFYHISSGKFSAIRRMLVTK